MNTITYRGHHGEEVTLPIGCDSTIMREGACLDICLQRSVAIDCPLAVTILIRTSGKVVLWSAEWSTTINTNWHFYAASDQQAEKRRPTDGQLRTLERMWLDLQELPGGLKGKLGNPVATWAFAGQTPEAIAAKHGKPPSRSIKVLKTSRFRDALTSWNLEGMAFVQWGTKSER